MNESAAKLTTEKQFELVSFPAKVELMTEDQAKHLLVEMHRQLIMREAITAQLIGKEWGIL